MVEQAAELGAQVAEIRVSLASHRQRVRESFDRAKANAPSRARTRMGHWFRNLVNRNYRESHVRLDSHSRELAEIEFRFRAIGLYTNLHDHAGSLRSRLTETRFSEDLEERLSRGVASLSEDLVNAVSPTVPYRELTEEQRARVGDRLEELEGLIGMTMKELDQRIHETDITKWFTGDTRPAAAATADAGTEEVTPLEKVQNLLEETKSKLQQTHEELDSLRGWTTFFGTLWLLDLLNDD